MNIKFWNQPKDICLGDILNEKLKKGFNKVWIVAGMTKDTGVDVIFDAIKEARELGSEVNILIGIDRKNTSKDMLMKLLKIGCNVSVHINRDDNKVETRMYIFESNENESFVYFSNGKFSEGGLLNNYCFIEEITYLQDDRKIFENFKTTFIQEAENIFKNIGEEEVKLLAEKGEIVARIIDRKIPKISEMYGQPNLDDTNVDNFMYDENTTANLFDIPKDDIDIDIDINIDGEMQKSELSVESEARKSKEFMEAIEKEAEKKLSKLYNNDENLEDKKVQIIKDVDAVDFESTKILVFELNKIIDKGAGEGEIKIPHSLYENLKNFFGEINQPFKDDKGKDRIGKIVKFDIIDVKSNEKIVDNNAYLYDTDKYFAIKSVVFNGLEAEERDIVRIIKQDEKSFCVELIRKGIKEYEIWEGFCKLTMKNTKRRYGVM